MRKHRIRRDHDIFHGGYTASALRNLRSDKFRIPMSNAASEVQCLHHVSHASGWFKSLYHVVLLYLSISIITSVSPVLALRILFYICISIPNATVFHAISPSWVFNGSISVSPANKKGQHTNSYSGQVWPTKIGRLISSIDGWKKEKKHLSVDPKNGPKVLSLVLPSGND